MDTCKIILEVERFPIEAIVVDKKTGGTDHL
jgi:hypothetical protein